MSRKSDLTFAMAKAIVPRLITSSGSVVAAGSWGMVRSATLTAAAGAAARAILRQTSLSGTAILALRAPAGKSVSTRFPAGLRYSDGLYVSLSGSGAMVGLVASPGAADAAPTPVAEQFTSEQVHSMFGFNPHQDVLGAGGVHNFLLMGV